MKNDIELGHSWDCGEDWVWDSAHLSNKIEEIMLEIEMPHVVYYDERANRRQVYTFKSIPEEIKLILRLKHDILLTNETK
jgi:hypothetical protein